MTEKQQMSLVKYKWKKFYPNVKLNYRIKNGDFGKVLLLKCTFGKNIKTLYWRYRSARDLSYVLQMFEEEFKKAALNIFLNSLNKKSK